MQGVFRTTAIAVFSLVAAGQCLAGSSPAYKDLPGVKSAEQRAKEKTPANCTSSLVSSYEHGRRGPPIRVYTCGDGMLTFRSTEQPAGLQPVPDPYVHGEGPQKRLGFDN